MTVLCVHACMGGVNVGGTHTSLWLASLGLLAWAATMATAATGGAAAATRHHDGVSLLPSSSPPHLLTSG